MLQTMTRDELYQYALVGLHAERDRVSFEIHALKRRLDGQLYATPSGQPACPVHMTDYSMSCDHCRIITGQTPGHTITKTSSKQSLAQKRRWAKAAARAKRGAK